MSAVLLDTDVLVRLLHTADPLHEQAVNAVRALRRQRSGFYTTVQNIAEFWNVCTRPPSSRNGLGFPVAEVTKRIAIINRWSQVLTESGASYAVWQRLVTAYSVQGAAVHDARLVSVMIAHGIAQILTFNGSDFVRYESEGISSLAPASIS
jgi:predicted nucleic acid-binding protein